MNMKKQSSSKEIRKTIWCLYKYTKKAFWQWGVWRWLGGIASASLNILIAKTMGSMLDIAIGGNWGEAVAFFIWISVFVLSRSLIGYTNSLTSYRYEVKSGYFMRCAAMDKINALPIRYFETKHTGTVISRLLNDIAKMQEFLPNSVAGIWSHTPVNILFGLFLLFAISWKLTLIVITVVMTTTFFLSKITVPLSDYTKAEQESMVKCNSYLRDFFEGNDLYKIFAMKETHGKKVADSVREQLACNKAIRKKRSWIRAVSSINYYLPWVLSYVVGSFFVARGEITIGELYAFAAILPNVTKVAWQMGDGLAAIVETSGIAKHYFELLETPGERADGEDFRLSQKPDAIEFNSVDYAYTGQPPVLSNCSLTVPKHSTVALVGGSGSGKTTLFKLLCGYYEDYDGDIRVNGHALREWNLKALRQNIAYVSQESYLFHDTILENIRCGKPGACDEEVIAAAKAAYADEFILQTEKGYHTVLGERGINLSGGQRQRLAIARAILRDAQMILLDEPTAALDTRSEFHVQKALDRLSAHKTVFVIAHRVSTVENADNILVLENGHIVEQGCHRELIANGGRYVELYSTQIAEEQANEA